MNRVLLKPVPRQYLLYCVHRNVDGFCVRSKQIDDAGRVSNIMDIQMYRTLAEARERIKTLVKLKQERKGLLPVTDVPEFVCKHFEDEDAIVVTNEQMLAQIEAAKRERYVTFCDVTGIEERFDLDVPYLAVTTEFEDTLDVTDKFGDVCTCFVSRFSKIEMTEDGLAVMSKEALAASPLIKKTAARVNAGNQQKCLTCDGNGKYKMCENYDRDCAVQAECLQDKCSCASQKLTEVVCRDCNGTGIKTDHGA